VRLEQNADSGGDALGSGRHPDRCGSRLGVLLARDSGVLYHVQPQASSPASPGYEFTRRQIPAELVVNRGVLRYTAPALTALDLCGAMGGDAIDQALRSRATTLAQLHRAIELTAARVGNPIRRQLLLNSREEPWSKAERLFHQLLRDAGITGWKANRPVVLAGSTFYVDVIFRRLKLAIEIDGRLYHTGTEVFESDRWRQNLLVLNGWCVLRFTWTMIEDHPEKVLAMVLDAIKMLTAAAL
jgi:very-short-patch-repair endonuclease